MTVEDSLPDDAPPVLHINRFVIHGRRPNLK